MARSTWGPPQSNPALFPGEARQRNKHLNASQPGSASTRDSEIGGVDSENKQKTFQGVVHVSLLLVQLHLVLVSAVFRPPEGRGLGSTLILEQ